MNQYEQGSERILNLLNSNLARIIVTEPRLAVDEAGLEQLLAGCSAMEKEFGRHRTLEKVKDLRNHNVSRYLATVAFMCKAVGSSVEEEDRAVAWYQEKEKASPEFCLVGDEVVPVLAEFFEAQLTSIMSQFPKEARKFIRLGLLTALFAEDADNGT